MPSDRSAMTPKQEKAAALIGLQLASAVALAIANGLEMGMPLPELKHSLKSMFNDMVNETTADVAATGAFDA